jgi:hypothetical protein
MSMTVPPPFAIPTLPKKPLSVRTAIRNAVLGARAVAICGSEDERTETEEYDEAGCGADYGVCADVKVGGDLVDAGREHGGGEGAENCPRGLE